MLGNRNTRRLTRMAAVLAVVTAAALLAAGSAMAAPITIQHAGATGTWSGEMAPIQCDNGMGFGAFIDPVEPIVNRTPSYPNQVQTIRMFSRVETWNGSGWQYYKQDSVWSSRTVYPGGIAYFSTSALTVANGRYYRVVQFYQWWVNGTLVGTATNRFDQSEYRVMGGSIGSTNEGGYCYIS